MNRNKNGKFTKKEEITPMAMLTFSQASTQYGIKKPELKRILASSRFASIFTADTVKTTVFHSDILPLVEISTEALDAYVTRKNEGAVGNRATRSGRDRKWLQYISDARIEEYRALMAEHGFNAPVAAYKAKANQEATSAPAVPQDSAAPVNLVEELIEA